MIRQRFQALEWALDERLRRIVAAAEAEAIGYGGPSMVPRATGVSRRGIRLGAEELKANKKTLEGASHPDRDAQFEYINSKVQEQIATNNPVISVDAKKKELVGNFKNDGQDFLSMATGK